MLGSLQFELPGGASRRGMAGKVEVTETIGDNTTFPVSRTYIYVGNWEARFTMCLGGLLHDAPPTGSELYTFAGC